MYFYNEKILADGRKLFMEFDAHTTPATFNDPAEHDESEPRFFIDGISVDWPDIPAEVTTEVIDELKDNASCDPDHYCDGPDE